jgi:hypothetical protein
MRIKHFALAFAFLGLALVSTTAAAYANGQPEALARAALSANAHESTAAIAALRAMGPAGLQTLFAVYADEIKRHTSDSDASASPKESDDWRRLSAALDSVSQQYDSAASGLYWYTDFEQARAAAKESGKPILSLRLLGNLNEEYSCANSRFFRTVLYSNAQLSKLLRERFILHWQSVRPVPRVTIDYGDGRKLERTLTGNSIHYILDPEGRPIDALPGLYGPQAFQRELLQAESIVKQTNAQPDDARAQILTRYHQSRIDALTLDWKTDVRKAGGKIPAEIDYQSASEGGTPSARAASRQAMSKAVTEVNIINSFTYEARLMERATDNATWNNIAALHAPEAKLDAASIALMRRQSFRKRDAAQTGASSLDETQAREQLSRLVSNFERYLALDTVRNEYLMHIKLHSWLMSYRLRTDLDKLNEKVYAELFLTPRSDPWLGLFSPDTYTALDGGGIEIK